MEMGQTKIKQWFWAVQAVFLVSSIVFVFIAMSFISTQKQVNRLETKVNGILRKNKGCFPSERFSKLKSYVGELQIALKDIDSKFEYIEDVDLSDIRTPGLYFMEKLSLLKTKYAAYINDNELVENLGFPRQMPAESDVPCFLRILSIEDAVLGLICKDKDIVIENMSVGFDESVDSSGCQLNIEVIGTFERTFELLKELLIKDDVVHLCSISIAPYSQDDVLIKTSMTFCPLSRRIWESGVSISDKGETE